LQAGVTKGQRGWKWQPEGGFMALGISPEGRFLGFRTRGSGMGTADKRALE